MSKKTKKNNTLTKSYTSPSGTIFHCRTNMTKTTIVKYDSKTKRRATFKLISGK